MIVLALCALAALLVPVVVPNSFYLGVANLVLINAMVAISLTLLLGTTGQLSLGHAAFFASGAYLSAYLAGSKGWSVLASIPVAMLGTAVLAWCIGRLFLRLSGYYLAVATLGVGLLLGIVLRNEQGYSGGPDGLSVAPLEIFGHALQGDAAWYWLLLVLLLIIIVAAHNLLRSPAGRALRALHDAEIAATTAGVDVHRYKVRIFVLSATLTGLMGALYAHYSGFITPTLASFNNSIEYVLMVVVGGLGSIAGAVLGAVIVTLLPTLLAGVDEYETLVAGSVLFATVLFMPDGIVPSVQTWLKKKP
ncbi:MAG: branched-chain amino acid ABC transporter permease [Pseudomonadota bacterium]